MLSVLTRNIIIYISTQLINIQMFAITRIDITNAKQRANTFCSHLFAHHVQNEV